MIDRGLVVEPRFLKLCYQQSGGFFGLFSECTIDTRKLSAESARAFIKLVDTSDIIHSKSSLSNSARDAILYDLTFERGGKLTSLSFDDTTLPIKMRPLINYLRSRAKVSQK